MDANLKLQVDQLVSDLTSPTQTLDDLNGLFRSLMQSARERRLDTAMNVPRGPPSLLPDSDPNPDPATPKNRSHGHSHKTVRGDMGALSLDTPRDRNGTFAPQRIPKPQRRLTGCDEQILALEATALTTRDIQDIVKELYGVDVSPTLISEITADLDTEVTQWRQRRLDALWPIVYLDGLVVPVRGDNGRVSKHTMDVAIGVNLQGKKELLGLWLGETEGAKFWLNCLIDLKNRGLNDIFIVCVDGLTGFPAAIRTAYPQTKVQLCLVHLVRAALKYVTDKDSQAVARDLKKIDQAATVLEAEQELENFAQAWGEKDPTIVNPWRRKWSDLIVWFDFPAAIRKAIDTTTVIASVTSVMRKSPRHRKQDPNAASAWTLVAMAIQEASRKGTMPMVGGQAALNPFAILCAERMPGAGTT